MSARFPRMVRLAGTVAEPRVLHATVDSNGVFHVSSRTHAAILDGTLSGSELFRRCVMDEEEYKVDMREWRRNAASKNVGYRWGHPS